MISSAIYIFGVIFYAVFASGEQQPWADESESSTMPKQQDTNCSFQIGINVHRPQTVVHRVQGRGKGVYLYGGVETREP